ncbi:MAG: carbohydrate-binding family 9-like protein [Candidatus Latescibacterota bacterium]
MDSDTTSTPQTPAGVPSDVHLDPRTLGLAAPPDYACCRLTGPLTVDGRLDEPFWQAAARLGPFVDMEHGTPVEHDTRVAFLWDDQAFYVGFRCEEPDVFGFVAERDGGVGGDQDFEVFILGEETYYELEMNPLNTIYEVFWTWVQPLVERRDLESIDGLLRTRRFIYGGLGDDYDMRHGSFDWDFPGLQSAVYVDGSLNWHRDRDRAWSGELVFPWAGWAELARGRRSIPPRPGDEWRVGCSRVEHWRDEQGKVVRGRDWSITQHGKVQMHVPHRWPRLIFWDRPAGA